MLPSLLMLALLSPGLTTSAQAADWPDLATAPAGAMADGGNDAALIIAVEDYVMPGVPDVPGARANGAAWKSYLKEARGVPVVKVLADAEASREAILEAAAVVRARVKPGGRAWLVYIGHGAPSKARAEGLLVAADAQRTAVSLYANSVGQGELLRALGAEAGVPVVAVIDACFSGETPSGQIVEGLQPLLPTALAETPRNVTVLAAGKSDQFAGPLPGLGRPAFSWLALGALRGWGDRDRDGVVTAQETVDFANDRLAELVNDRRQEPQVAGRADAPLGKGREKAPELEGLAAVAAPPPAPPRANTPLPAPKGGASGGGAVDDDVAALLRVKDLKAAREKQLTDLVAAKQAEAAAAWGKLSAVLGEGSPEEIAVVEKFQKTWTGAKVWVEDAEGRHERAVAVSALDLAQAWLAKAGKGVSGRDWQSPTLGTMKWIPAGSFLMGSPASEPDRSNDEAQHRVTLTKGFWMMEHEVTQGEWQAVMGTNPSTRPDWECIRLGNKAPPAANEPVYCVSWDEAVEFARRASARDGVSYALPTEAQWEYAARGGGAGRWAGGDEPGAVAWTSENSGGRTRPVCGKARNGYGLCDMSGNVWEWTADGYADSLAAATDPKGPSSGARRVRRGGGWYNFARNARVAYRVNDDPGYRSGGLGLRLSRTVP